jgi:hypothetical protein
MNFYTLKQGSRLDSLKGYLITQKEYECQILMQLKFNYVIITIGNKKFKTDKSNLK